MSTSTGTGIGTTKKGTQSNDEAIDRADMNISTSARPRTRPQTSNLKKQKCEEMTKFYLSRFEDIPILKSEKYLRQRLGTSTCISSCTSKHTSGSCECIDYLLVDVRTKVEQEASMIPSAMTLQEFEHKMISEGTGAVIGDEKIIVTYCTVGHRSGMEARRICDVYNIPNDRIMNLDGIVSYTHACKTIIEEQKSQEQKILMTDMDTQNKQQHQQQQQKQSQSYKYNSESTMFLINPKTKSETNVVHTFGKTWDYIDDDMFQSTYFSWFVMLWNGFLVTMKGWCSSCRCFNCCCPKK